MSTLVGVGTCGKRDVIVGRQEISGYQGDYILCYTKGARMKKQEKINEVDLKEKDERSLARVS